MGRSHIIRSPNMELLEAAAQWEKPDDLPWAFTNTHTAYELIIMYRKIIEVLRNYINNTENPEWFYFKRLDVSKSKLKYLTKTYGDPDNLAEETKYTIHEIVTEDPV